MHSTHAYTPQMFYLATMYVYIYIYIYICMHTHIYIHTQVLDAASNRVQALPGQMKQNIQLRELLLENNRLTTIPPVILELHNLKELRLASNRLSVIPDEIYRVQSLTHLSLEFNKVKYISVGLSGLFFLKVFRMSNNGLTEVPGALVKLRREDDPFDHESELCVLFFVCIQVVYERMSTYVKLSKDDARCDH
jgi:Leucine-rich repeat (LRR) protein